MKIECEITMVFRPNENNQGFAFTTKQNMGDLEKFYNKENENYTVNYWHNNKPVPAWIIKGQKVILDLYENKKGYLTIGEAQPIGSEEDDFNKAVDELSQEQEDEILEGEIVMDNKSKEEKKKDRIQVLVNNYADVFLCVNTHKSLVSLDTNLKKDIATHINITLTNEGY
tara:strand:+ start:1868 stop:2377 length:510 start_codon:yes stop_codon:yes gene_type:complete